MEQKMDRIDPMTKFEVRLFDESAGKIQTIPLSTESVGDVRTNPGHNNISETQLEMRRYIRRRVKNVINAAIIGNSLLNIAEYFECIYTFIHLGLTDAPFPNFVKNTTSFDFGDFTQLRRMIYGISDRVSIFRTEPIIIDLFTYTNQYMKRKDREAADAYLKKTLDSSFIELFENYNKIMQKFNRMYVIVAPDTPKYLKNPYALPSQIQQPDRIILPPENYRSSIATIGDVLPADIKAPEEKSELVSKAMALISDSNNITPEQSPVKTESNDNEEVKFPFVFPNGEQLIEVKLNDGIHYLVLGKNMNYDWAMRIKNKIESMDVLVGKTLTIDRFNSILRIMELLQCNFTKEQIADYMYRTKQMTLSDIRQYRD